MRCGQIIHIKNITKNKLKNIKQMYDAYQSQNV